MECDRCNEPVFETINEYLIIEEQNKELIEILVEMEMLNEEAGQHLINSILQLKHSMEVCKNHLLRQSNSKDRVCDSYRILNILMDFKDLDERIFEILENKLQFPMEDRQRKLLQYFTCDAGIRILFNTKTRYKLNTYVFNTMSKGRGC